MNKKPITTPRERMLKNIRKALLEKRDNPYPNYEDSPVYPPNHELLEIIFAEELNKISGHFCFVKMKFNLLKIYLILLRRKIG